MLRGSLDAGRTGVSDPWGSGSGIGPDSERLVGDFASSLAPGEPEGFAAPSAGFNASGAAAPDVAGPSAQAGINSRLSQTAAPIHPATNRRHSVEDIASSS